MSGIVIKLERMGSTPWGTLGMLRHPDGTAYPTVEPKWEYNAVGASCIPAGEYTMQRRASPIVARTSGGEFRAGWEIDGVPRRDLIMIHPGNHEADTQGCILPGRAFAVINGTPGVSASRAAFRDLMNRLSGRTEWTISIKWINPEGT